MMMSILPTASRGAPHTILPSLLARHQGERGNFSRPFLLPHHVVDDVMVYGYLIMWFNFVPSLQMFTTAKYKSKCSLPVENYACPGDQQFSSPDVGLYCLGNRLNG
jgi:hypothetical protein